MDGKTTVEEAARRPGIDLREACRIVAQLIEIGALLLEVREEG
mgnify:CR=1 FL=1